MANTIITVDQICKTTHDIEIRGILSDEQLDTVAEKVGSADSLDSILDFIGDIGGIVLECDKEGCYEGSEFDWNDDYVDNSNGEE
jgi:hypothetical protein